jgi:Caspase domain
MVPSEACARAVALVIGNAAYQATPPLSNPDNDARSMARALRGVGFEVAEHVDLDKSGMDDALRQFARTSRGAEVALFFYAGHGLAVGEKSYLVPIDAELNDPIDLDFETMTLEVITRVLESEPRTSLIFLDACRDNPLARRLARGLSATRSAAVTSGLMAMSAGSGMLIAYATQPGYVAADGLGEHSPFTDALLRHIGSPGLEVRQLMTRVRKEVLAATDGRQQPWDHSSLTEDFYFAKAPSLEATVSGPGGGEAMAGREEAFWRGIADSRQSQDFELYLELYPNGLFTQLAQRRLQALSPGRRDLGASRYEASAAQVMAAPPAGSTPWSESPPTEQAEVANDSPASSEFRVYRYED